MKVKKKNGFATAKRNENIFYYVMVAIPVIQFLVFYVVVNFNSFLLAFKSYEFNAKTLGYDESWVGLKNFKDFLDGFFSQGGNLTQILKNSLIVYITSLFFGTAFALLFSYYIYKKQCMSGFFRVILFMPSILSSIVVIVTYGYFVDRAVPAFMDKVFSRQITPLLDEYKFPTILFYNVFMSFGTSVLMYTGAMSRIPDGVIEAGEIDGVGPLREFFTLVLPLIAPTVSTFLITGVAGLFTADAHLYAFFGEGASEKVQTLGYYLFIQVMSENSTLINYPYAAAAGLALAFVAAPLTLLVRYVLEKVIPAVEY